MSSVRLPTTNGFDSTTLQALAVGGLSEQAARLGDELQEYHLEQQARLRGLQEYREQADAWVTRAVGLTAEESPLQVPQNFDAATHIVRALALDSITLPLPSGQRQATADELLDQALFPLEPQAASTYMATMVLINALLPTQSASEPS